MSEIIFRHKDIDPLTISIRPNGVAWSYHLNTAAFHTYGGEVVQILSCYIDNMSIEGDVKSYPEAEDVYAFFARYFTIATQGSTADAGPDTLRFEQHPMILEYPEREWTFHIQPLSAPGFTYSREMVTPAWKLKAHIIDQELYNEELKRYVAEFATKELEGMEGPGENFNLTGELSPINGDPASNPFIAPLVPGVSDQPSSGRQVTFNPISQAELDADVKRFADYYTSLIPSYLKGDFADVTQVAASSPIFGQPGLGSVQKEREAEQKVVSKAKGKGK